MHNLQQEKTIYQFASIASVKCILENSTLKFTRPSDFNDPFDCDIDLLDFNLVDNISEAVRDAIETIKQNYPNPNSPLLDPKSELCILKNYFKNIIKEHINQCRISCFSIVNDPVLMWSHYASKHGGVCIEFNNHVVPRFPLLNEDLDVSEGVVYYNAHERINFFMTDIKAVLSKLFLSKSESWGYEREYRMILFDNDIEFHQFSPEFISGVYFDLKVNDEDRHFIMSLSKNNFNHLKFYNSSKSNLNLVFNQI